MTARSPESNGIIAESFREDDKRTTSASCRNGQPAAVMNLAVAFSHYNEHHPHSARWDIAHHGNIYAGSRNHKRAKTFGYIVKSIFKAYSYLEIQLPSAFQGLASMAGMGGYVTPIRFHL